MSTDPKQASGAAKAPLHLLPPAPMALAAAVLQTGADKYGAWNWRTTGVSIMTYVAAIRRHLDALVDGPLEDPESSLPHLAHIAASAAIVLDAQAHGTLTDDRPPSIHRDTKNAHDAERR